MQQLRDMRDQITGGSKVPTELASGLPSFIKHDRHGRCRVSFFKVPLPVSKSLKIMGREIANKSSWADFNQHFMRQIKPQPNEPRLEWIKSIRGKKDGFRMIGGRHTVGYVEEAMHLILSRCLKDQFGVHSGIADWFLGYLETLEEDMGQQPHVDYEWEMLNTTVDHNCANSSDMARPMPHSAVIPVEESGCSLEIWPDVDFDRHCPGTERISSHLVEIPYGYGLMFRGDVVHSGGLGTGRDRILLGNQKLVYDKAAVGSNLRAHVYVYPKGGCFSHMVFPKITTTTPPLSTEPRQVSSLSLLFQNMSCVEANTIVIGHRPASDRATFPEEK